jgi:hypothetical protein
MGEQAARTSEGQQTVEHSSPFKVNGVQRRGDKRTSTALVDQQHQTARGEHTIKNRNRPQVGVERDGVKKDKMRDRAPLGQYI